MRLSTYTDYSLRVLMQAAIQSPERVTVDEVADTFSISRHHLVKVVNHLGRSGFLKTYRGVGGGFTLGDSQKNIRLGEIVRLGEEVETVIDCKDGENHFCPLWPSCRLKRVLDEASAAFFEVLDRYSLADLVKQPAKIRTLLGI